MFPQRIPLLTWNFLPSALSSSSLGLYKRIKDTGFTFDVIHGDADVHYPSSSRMLATAKATFHSHQIHVLGTDSRAPETSAEYVRLSVAKFEELAVRNRYRCFMTHSHPPVSHQCGLRIKEAHPDLFWVASFGDSIANTPFNKYYTFPTLPEETAMERRVLELADRVVVTCEQQRRVMAKGHPRSVLDKIEIVPHCFDPAMYPYVLPASDKFVFMHIGMFYKHKRTAEPIMQGFRRLLEKFPEYKDKFQAIFYGANPWHTSSFKNPELEKHVVFGGKIPYLASLGEMRRADALLLRDADFGDDGWEESIFYPGKLADYWGADKPIIGVTMNQGFTAETLDRFNMPYATENETEKLAGIYKSAIDGKYAVRPGYAECFHSSKAGRKIETIFCDPFVGPAKKKNILFAGHDLKFAKHIIEYFQEADGYEVRCDNTKHGGIVDEQESRLLLEWADVIFCEWGLGNAVWYSNNKRPGQKLIVRMHLQERETPYPSQFDMGAVDAIISIAPYWFEEFQKLFPIPREKMKIIFNLVDMDAFRHSRHPDSVFHLGIVGIVPQRKRFDRALDILERLYKINRRYKLFIKGKLPQDYPWMLSKKFKHEFAYYESCYKRIENSKWRDNVIYDPQGDDMGEWYSKIGYLLSPSDFEGSHHSVAESMAAGCVPVINCWDGAALMYPRKYVHQTTEEMVEAIRRGFDVRECEDCRSYAQRNFDKTVVVGQIEKLIHSS